MSLLALVNGRVLTQHGIEPGLAVVIEGRDIVAVVPEANAVDSGAATHDLADAYLLPGFIDCQVNGGGGVLFNNSPDVDALRRIGEAHRRFGTTGFLPTLISDELHKMKAAI
ncbi:MAG TPA: N-acetylglucosamine-6-phosphate deacetylase, partial [Pseudoxanthomonas sp.]